MCLKQEHQEHKSRNYLKKKKPKLKILSESNLNSLISVKAQPWIKAEILKPKF